MLTRHFYKEDEVRSALMWCCCFGRVREALFWNQELIDSNCGEDALRILIHAWILFYGIGCVRWIQHAYELWSSDGFGEEDLQLLAYQLVSLPNHCHDSTILSLLYLGTQEFGNAPDRLTNKGTIPDTGRSLFEQTVYRAVAQGKCEYLWYLLRSEWNTPSLWNLLSSATNNPEKKEYLQTFQKIETLMGDELKVWFFRALAVATVTCPEPIFQKSNKELPKELNKTFQEDCKRWEENLGKKMRREYSIPKDCLYWVTERGNTTFYESTLDEIPDLLLYLGSNAYWKEALNNTDFDDFTEQEKLDFLESYMPDGHPMTWDKKELEKSHGSGVLRKEETPNHCKWLRIWIRSTESSLVWRGAERAYQIANTFPDLDINTFYAEHETLWKEHMSNWNLNPVKKILVLKTDIPETFTFEKHPEQPEVSEESESVLL